MKTEPIKFRNSILPIMGGAFFGLLILVSLRVAFYQEMGYQPNMAPAVSYFFSPILLLVVMIGALPLEAIFRRFWHAPTNTKQSLVIGMGYSSFFTWWAFPGIGIIGFVFNPILVRWSIGLLLRGKEN